MVAEILTFFLDLKGGRSKTIDFKTSPRADVFVSFQFSKMFYFKYSSPSFLASMKAS